MIIISKFKISNNPQDNLSQNSKSHNNRNQSKNIVINIIFLKIKIKILGSIIIYLISYPSHNKPPKKINKIYKKKLQRLKIAYLNLIYFKK